MSTLFLTKTYPAGPLAESRAINLPSPPSSTSALIASLSGPLDDYIIQKSDSGTHITAHARLSYQSRYRSTQERLSRVEIELGTLRDELGTLRDDNAHNNLILLRSQIYSKLLLNLENQLLNSLPSVQRQQVIDAGLTNLPQLFATWWTAWNIRDPVKFPLPACMSQSHDEIRHILPVSYFLFNRYGGESRKGKVLCEAWEILGSVKRDLRDLVLYSWCMKMSISNTGNLLAHPAMKKSHVENILQTDLSHGLIHLREYAILAVQPFITI